MRRHNDKCASRILSQSHHINARTKIYFEYINKCNGLC